MNLGELCAIGCALAWSVAVIMFKIVGSTVPAVSLNLFKSVVGLALLVPTVWLVEGQFVIETSVSHAAILIASGVLGIGIADALALHSLSLIGATRWAVVECLYSPTVILISLAAFGERLDAVQICGTLLVLSAIFCVSRAKDELECSRAILVRGVAFGALAIAAMAIGILAVKPLFDEVPLIWIITVRVAGGVLGSIVVATFTTGIRGSWRHIVATNQKLLLVSASVLSTYVAMILWVAGYKFNDASVAAVLNQTATIFIVVLAIIFLRERMTWRKLTGAVLALAGVLAITLG